MTAAQRDIEEDGPPNYRDILRDLGVHKLFTEVPLDWLKTDPAYQREPVRNRVIRIVKNFDDRLTGVLTCSARDDGIYVVDGGHRLAALRELGKTVAVCEVRDDLSPQDEAYLFYRLDSQRANLGTEDAFHALLFARNPDALAVKQAVDNAGFRIIRGPIENGVRAYRTMLGLYRRYGYKPFEMMLRVLHDAWPNIKNAAPARVQMGMAWFLDLYPEVDRKELSRILTEHSSPEELVRDATLLTSSMSWSTKGSMTRAILNLYNKYSNNTLEDRTE